MPDEYIRGLRAYQPESHRSPAIEHYNAGPVAIAGEPAFARSLFGNPHLSGRGNEPMRQAALLSMQRTHGNRAVQRHAISLTSNSFAIQRTPSRANHVAMQVQCSNDDGWWNRLSKGIYETGSQVVGKAADTLAASGYKPEGPTKGDRDSTPNMDEVIPVPGGIRQNELGAAAGQTTRKESTIYPTHPNAFSGVSPYFMARDQLSNEKVGGEAIDVGDFRLVTHLAEDQLKDPWNGGQAVPADYVTHYTAYNKGTNRHELAIGPESVQKFMQDPDAYRSMINLSYQFTRPGEINEETGTHNWDRSGNFEDGQPSARHTRMAKIGDAWFKGDFDKAMYNWGALNEETVKDPWYWVELATAGLFTAASGPKPNVGGGAVKGAAGGRSPLGQVFPELTEAEINAAFNASRSQSAARLPGQNPRTGQGLQDMKIKGDPTDSIAYHENMKFKGRKDSPHPTTEVRYHTGNSNAPAGSYSRDNPTIQMNTKDGSFRKLPNGTWKRDHDMTAAERAVAGPAQNTKLYQLPDGSWKPIGEMTPAERAAAHYPAN